MTQNIKSNWKKGKYTQKTSLEFSAVSSLKYEHMLNERFSLFSLFDFCGESDDFYLLRKYVGKYVGKENGELLFDLTL